MPALCGVSAFPFFRVPRFALWEPKGFCAWLIQIGRRLAVLRRSLSASICSRGYCNLSRGCINLVDFLAFGRYRQAKWQPPTGAWYVTGSHARLPADGSSAEVTWAGASTPVPSRESLPYGSVPAPVHFREIQFGSSPFTGANRLSLNLPRGASEAVPPAVVSREYSAGWRLLPFLVHMISALFIMFHKVVRTPGLSSGTVGNFAVRICSMSGAVKRSCGSSAMTDLIVSESLENPVACAVSAPREPLTACSSCRFFCTRLASNSASISSFWICFTKSDWMPRSLT